MNNLAQTLGSEEPDVVSIAVQPGMVDTEMQRELREDHKEALDAEMHSKFTGALANNALFQPEQPGDVMARLVLDAPKSLSGIFAAYVQSTSSLLQIQHANWFTDGTGLSSRIFMIMCSIIDDRMHYEYLQIEAISTECLRNDS